jgi:uncharacterized protein
MSRSEAPLRYAVGDLLADPGARRAVRVDAPVDWRLESSQVASPVRGDLVLQGTSGGVFATGEVVAEVAHTCERCLRVWAESVTVTVAELVGGEDAEYPLDDDVADLEPVLRDAVLLGVPVRPLCRSDCLGLCATCGADLNTGACPGHEEDADGPFTALRGLLEP